jgi:hypothetical protein
MFMTVYSPKRAPSTAPKWLGELRMRLAAQQKAAEAEKTAAKATRVRIANARKRRARVKRREQFVNWFAASLEREDGE